MEENKMPSHPVAGHDVFNEHELETIGLRTQASPSSICSKVQKIRCSLSTTKSLLFKYLPFLSWLPRYPIKEWLLGDIISGFSVGIMHLPQGLAYALLAGVPPVIGLYSSFYPVLLYFFFGTSRHISVGPFAVISVMIGSITQSLEPSSDYMESINGTNLTSLNEAERDAARVELVAAITVLVGIFQVALGLLQFGFVATYLSEPLVRAYTTAAAVQVLISQLEYIFGLDVDEYSGPLSLIYIVVDLCSKLPATNIGTLVTSLVAMVSILIVKVINDKLKLPIPLPIELLTIIVSTGVSYGAGLHQEFGISVVGEIPSGLTIPKGPNVSYFGKVVGNAFAIAVVSYVICISLGKIFALKHGYNVDNNQMGTTFALLQSMGTSPVIQDISKIIELLALGLSNFVGGLFQCCSISCSMSRSLVQESTGGNSQVAALVSCLIILITILKIGELFRELPKAILAAIILVNLKGMFKQFKDIPTLWQSNRIDLLVWLVTFVATILLNLDIGLGVAVVFSLLTVIFRTQMPHYSILGEVSMTGIYKDIAEYQKAEEIPGVKIFHSSSTIYFANAALYTEAIKKKCGIPVDQLIKKKKKALKKQQKKEKKEEKEKKKMASKIYTVHDAGVNNVGFVDIDMEAKAWEPGNDTSGSNGNVRDWESQNHNEAQSCSTPDLKALGLEKPSVHTIILDLTSINFVDTVCIKTLTNIFKDFREIEVDVFFAGCHGSVISQLERGGFFSKTITKQHLFATVHDAVTYATWKQGESSPQNDRINPIRKI